MPCLAGVADLARDGEAVGGVELLGVGVEAARRGEVGRPKQLAEALEPMAQHRQAPLMGGIERPAEIVQQGLFSLALLKLGQVLPLLGLGLLDEGQHLLGEEAPVKIEAVALPFPVAAHSGQVVLDGGFKGLFCVLSGHQANPLQLHDVNKYNPLIS